MRFLRVTCFALAAFLYAIGGQPARAQIGPTPIPGISVEIADVIDFPDTRDLGPQEQGEDNRVRENIARINFLRELPGGTDRWFVNDLRGDLYMVDANATSQQSYINLRAEFPRFRYGASGLATGFISMTPHPEFATNGKFYTVHTEINTDSPAPDFVGLGNAGNITGTNSMHSVITEWTATNPAANVFSGTKKELMRTAAPAGFLHGQGDLAFNPLADPSDADYGLLYIAGGDFGYDAYNKGTAQAQNLASIYGKILRIDPAGSNSANGQYGIPAANPFASDGDPNTAAEVYASGFRNAHRIMWDSVTGAVLSTDIGQGNIEEVNIIHAGGNYGWNQREGTFLNGGGTIPGNPDTDGFTYPVAQYDHGDGDAIAGGFVYRGTAIPQLAGKFVYGDILRGRVFYSDLNEMIAADDGVALTTAPVHELFLTRNGAPTSLEDLILADRGIGSLPSGRHDLRFGQTSDGEIYVMTKQDGWIRKLTNVAGPDELVLTVNRATGEVTMRNATGDPVEIDQYSILSASGSLNPNNSGWNSLADQGLPGWGEANALVTALSEQNPTGSLLLNAADTRSVGKAYAPAYSTFGATGPEDVQFEYRLDAGGTVTGIVEYIGIDVTNNLVLTVDPVTGYARLKNTSPFDVAIDGYSILSVAGLLLPGNGNWKSLTDQGVSGWVEAAPTNSELSELNALSALLLESGDTYDMGRLFNPSGEPDLQFEFFVDGEAPPRLGVITYASVGFPGDYNGNGAVDAADYVLWRDTNGQQVAAFTSADGNGDGTIDAADYSYWRARFGNTIASGSGSGGAAAVPEPMSALLSTLALLAWLAIRPRSW